MTIIIAVFVVSFIFGGVMGMTMGLFIAGVGKNNKEHEYYYEGFMDGYNKSKEENQ